MKEILVSKVDAPPRSANALSQWYQNLQSEN